MLHAQKNVSRNIGAVFRGQRALRNMGTAFRAQEFRETPRAFSLRCKRAVNGGAAGLAGRWVGEAAGLAGRWAGRDCGLEQTDGRGGANRWAGLGRPIRRAERAGSWSGKSKRGRAMPSEDQSRSKDCAEAEQRHGAGARTRPERGATRGPRNVTGPGFVWFWGRGVEIR